MDFELSDPKTLRSPIRRFSINIKIRRYISHLSGHSCSFPGCNENLTLNGASFIGHVAQIESSNPFSPRYNSSLDEDALPDPDNYLLLCPNHHAIIDRQPEVYSPQWLKKARDQHLKIIALVTSSPSAEEVKLDDSVQLSITEALDVWRKNRANASEEFWQRLLERCPTVLAQSFPTSTIKLGSKCYVGGKSVNNSGGNIIDFLYTNKTTGNVILIEIKTPKTRLLGKHYRTNAFAISEDLTGSITQILNYKEQITMEYHSLVRDSVTPFSTFNPKCILVVGDIEAELTTSTKIKSFELFRNTLKDVDIISYDELFQKAQDVLEIMS